MKTHLAGQSESRQVGNASMSPSLQKAEQAHVVDARPEALMQRKLQEAADTSVQAGQLLAMSAVMNSSSRSSQLQSQAQHSSSRNFQNAAMPAQRKIPLIDSQEAAQRVEQEEPLQAKFDTVQREEDEELVQARSAEQGATQLAEKTNDTGLPNQLKTGIESLSGMSMDHVKVHYNSNNPAQLNAHAYAQGSEIHVAPGQEQHLPHEAWHVVQQAQGRVRPTMQMKTGIPVNDDVGLEAEADVMGAKALSHSMQFARKFTTGKKSDYAETRNPAATMPAEVPIQYLNGQRKTLQRRVADPTGLSTATPAVVDGARRALIETIFDLKAIPDRQQWVTDSLQIDGDRPTISDLVAHLSVTNLTTKINLIRVQYPDQRFDSSGFDVKPVTASAADLYIQALITATAAKMNAAASNQAALETVFGDGTLGSTDSVDAAATAAGKITTARTKLLTFSNIFIDSGGVAQRVGIGGYANFGAKIFLLVQDVTQIPPLPSAVATLFHETMHLAHSEIKDDGGYTTSGLSFAQRSIPAKLKNADHYAEIARIIDVTSTHVGPFTPVDGGGGGFVGTNPNDTKATMRVRENVQHRGRQLWSGAADLFQKAVSIKRSGYGLGSSDTSEKLHMTYHNTPWFKRPDFNEVDLSLAEGTVNRLNRFTKDVNSYVNNAGDTQFNYINQRYGLAPGVGAAKEQAAGKTVLVDLGNDSDILAPQDKQPSVSEYFQAVSR
ncbi:eCIS core domain-containing protein [Undibacterium terreum]|uniref:eCIS core domain-containing protein n=1 Tax=Undibacterium terreum TaxID=1224302 RepID=A0A916ULM5_9BURK|nr:DUF4157 domain-containing protein [Undibacterium terreum]GGC76619.1 hypothetical protein GCM10011396_24810 [Undibacterium terreum]